MLLAEQDSMLKPTGPEIFFLVLAAGCVLLFCWALVASVREPSIGTGARILGVLVMLAFPALGPVIVLCLIRSAGQARRAREAERAGGLPPV